MSVFIYLQDDEMITRATVLSFVLCCSFASFADTDSVPKLAQASPAAQSANATTAATANSTVATAGGAPYTVVGTNKVDSNTLQGWRTWRAQACERCHGPAQEGLVGPSLVNSLKTLTKEEFVTTLKNGRIEKGMPNFGGVQNVVDNLDNLYAYLKGRSDGAIAPGRLEAIEK
jgi:mono/diheme cytochrome c family protein